MAIFDCFTFNNELDILELRMSILHPYVDHFVLVEAGKTHHGDDKPYYYNDNKERFKRFNEKIIHVQIEDAPQYRGEADVMYVENFQRNSIMRGLVNNCRPEDYIIISDVDEIPNPKILKNLDRIKIKMFPNLGSWKQNLRQHLRMYSLCNNKFIKDVLKKREIYFKDIINYTAVGLEQDLFYYYMNCKSRGKWTGPYIAKYSHLQMPQDNRELSYQKQLPVIKNAGWHFSYLGGIDSIKNKLKVVVDPDPGMEKKVKKAEADEQYIEKCLKNGIDLFGRKGKLYEFDFIDLHKIGIFDIEKIKEKHPDFFH